MSQPGCGVSISNANQTLIHMVNAMGSGEGYREKDAGVGCVRMDVAIYAVSMTSLDVGVFFFSILFLSTVAIRLDLRSFL
jgi:hypothetical protein